MSVSSFTPVSWSPGEPVDNEKLRVMSDNIQFLYEKMPKVLYSGFGITKDRGIKILAAPVTFGKTSSHVSEKTLYFGNLFSPGCRPIIAVAENAYPQSRFHIDYRGIDTTSVDHRGAIFRIASDEVTKTFTRIGNTVVVTVIVIGW